jgi:hypothetical protein
MTLFISNTEQSTIVSTWGFDLPGTRAPDRILHRRTIYVDFTFTWNQDYLFLENPMKEFRNIFRDIIRKTIVEAYMGNDTITVKPIEPKNKEYEGIADGSEVTILKNKIGELYAFMRSNYGDNDFAAYTERQKTYIGKDEDGDPDFEDDDYSDVYVDKEVVARYVNDNLKSLTVGQGLEGWSNGSYDLIKIDSDLASEIFSLYPKDQELTYAMSPTPEVTTFTDLENMKLKTFTMKGADKPFGWSILNDKNQLITDMDYSGSLYIHPIKKRFDGMNFQHDPTNAVRFVFLKLYSNPKKP